MSISKSDGNRYPRDFADFDANIPTERINVFHNALTPAATRERYRKSRMLACAVGENDYIAFAEYYNEPIGRSFGNCEIPFVTS